MEKAVNQKIVLYKDIAREQRTIADLETACTLINATIKQLEGENLLPLNVNEQLIRAICLHDASDIVKAIRDAFASDSKIFSMVYARKMFADNADAAANRVYEIIAELEKAERAKAFVLRLSDYDRANLLHETDGKATFDKEEIAELCTSYASGAKAVDYIKRARELHKAMADFDRETQLLSRGGVRGVCDDDVFQPCIIPIIDGVIWLDLKAVESLDFDNADTLLQGGKIIDNAKIAKSER